MILYIQKIRKKEIKIGYYTNFSLEAYTDPRQKWGSTPSAQEEYDMMKRLCEISDMWAVEDIDEGCPFDIITWECYKWYDHNEHMTELSKEFPNVWFILEGEGEDQGDIWRTMYHNGRYETVYAEITFPDFNMIEEE